VAYLPPEASRASMAHPLPQVLAMKSDRAIQRDVELRCQFEKEPESGMGLPEAALPRR
jgi:hypothetical protein